MQHTTPRAATRRVRRACAALGAAVMLATVAAFGGAASASGATDAFLRQPSKTAAAAEARPTRVAIANGKPGGWFPSEPSPRDGLVFLMVVDVSCDETRLAAAQLENVIFTSVSYAAWHEGDFGIAPMRNNAILNLDFQFTHPFRSDKKSEEAVRRDLWHQRNEVDVNRFVRFVDRGRRGPCRTDQLEALKQVQAELSGLGVGARSVIVAMIGNGVVSARGLNFRKPQPEPSELVRKLKARGMVAHLPNVSLVFVGVGHTRGVGSRKLDWLNAFWSRYATAAGAHALFLPTADALVGRIRGEA
jgi:hypothetical protein